MWHVIREAERRFMTRGTMRRLLLAGMLVGSLATFAPSASAALVQIGETPPIGTPLTACVTDCQDMQLATAAGTSSYAVPTGDAGVIKSFNVLDPPSGYDCNSVGGCRAQLLVFRPTGTAGEYTYVGASSSDNLASDGVVSSQPADIPVKPGDVIGLNHSYIPTWIGGAGAGDVAGQADPCMDQPGDSCTPSPESSRLLAVSAEVQVPTAAFTASTPAVQGTAVSFDGSASTTGATAIIDYKWSFGDGQAADARTTATTSHIYTSPGTYTVTLTITDSDDNTNTTSEAVEVAAPAPPRFLGSTLATTKLATTRQGSVTLSLACSDTAVSSCTDAVALYGTGGPLPTAAFAAKSLGSATFTIASGATATEHLMLDATGRKLIRKHALVPARLLLTASDGAQRTITRTTDVSLKRIAAKHKHQRQGRLAAVSLPQF
jgi:PKD repeat protein